jgi:hypothetical protein
MLSIETRVNGALIGYTCIVNKGQIQDSNLRRYSINHYRFDKQPSSLQFDVVHNQEEGLKS